MSDHQARVHRDRPNFVPALADPYGSSFPSGHAMQSVAIYGVLLMIAAPRVAPRTRALAWVWWWFA